MPNVPQVPGVPQLSSYAATAVGLLTGDAAAFSVFAAIAGVWGVFLDGLPAFIANSVVDFDFKQDWPISDYPVEDGSFLSYDKVQLPFDVRVRLASGGTEIERQLLLTEVLAAANTLNLYDVVTPEQTFSGCNISHVDFKRQSHNGVGLILIDIWFVQVRVTATSTFSNTQSPTVAGQQSGGLVTPQTPSQAVAAGTAPVM
jgi:hypothetical protein